MAVWRNGRRDGFKTHFLTECEFDSHHGYVNQVLFKVKTTKNLKLSDDEFVEDVMNKLVTNYPQVKGYMYERVGPEHIHILMWGEFRTE